MKSRKSASASRRTTVKAPDLKPKKNPKGGIAITISGSMHTAGSIGHQTNNSMTPFPFDLTSGKSTTK